MIALIFTSGDQIGLFLKESILVPIQQKASAYFGAYMDSLDYPFSNGCNHAYSDHSI